VAVSVVTNFVRPSHRRSAAYDTWCCHTAMMSVTMPSGQRLSAVSASFIRWGLLPAAEMGYHAKPFAPSMY
jgi:hypothetical protein